MELENNSLPAAHYKLINVIGKPCPIPVIEAKKALHTISVGEEVKILIDNDISRENLEKMARSMGFPFLYEKKEDETILVTITKSIPEIQKNVSAALVIVIGKNTFGSGDDNLGAILLKSFIYSLTELENPPKNILFFNSGVFLTIENSNVIADLKILEKKGTGILICGTCLDFYELKEKVAVGSISNMYTITSVIANAEKLFNV